MDSVKHQNCQSNLSQFNLRSLKVATTLLASVCFFSVVVFSYSSLLPFMSDFIQFSSFNIEKNYVFLFCNGILVLIAKNSGLISNSHQDTTTSLYGEQKVKRGGSPHKVVEVSETMKPVLVAEKKVVMEVKEAEETVKDKTLVIAGGDEQGDREIVVIDEGEEVEEEEVIGLPSKEELKKKCDAFIRKMRDEIKFEAQQLVMVRY